MLLACDMEDMGSLQRQKQLTALSGNPALTSYPEHEER